MASTSACESTSSKKKVPEAIMDLLDLAIFSFGCQSGLRSYHKIRGDPVIEGVCAFFGRLVKCSSPETLKLFNEIAGARLGGWEPGSVPSKELNTLVSSRLKTLKSKGQIRDNEGPEVPNLLLLKKQKYLEETDRMKTSRFSKCWRCNECCEFCRTKTKSFPHYLDSFNVDIASPFLGVLEDVLNDECEETMTGDDDHSDIDCDITNDHDNTGDGDVDDDTGDDDDDLQKCTSNTSDFPDSTDDDDEEYSMAADGGNLKEAKKSDKKDESDSDSDDEED